MSEYPLVTKTWPIVGRKATATSIMMDMIPDISIILGMIDLWIILEQIVQDWIHEVEKHQCEIDTLTGDEKRQAVSEAFSDIKPRYIQCLFSYIIFFLMIENGYKMISSQLNKFGSNHWRDKKVTFPERTAFIKKVVTVRHYSIAHWAAPERKHPTDAKAGLYWGLSWPADDIEKIEFGHGNLRGAKPRDLPPILDVHSECKAYLQDLDKICTEHLKAIKSKLPISKDGWEYTDLDHQKPVAPDGTKIVRGGS